MNMELDGSIPHTRKPFLINSSIRAVILCAETGAKYSKDTNFLILESLSKKY